MARDRSQPAYETSLSAAYHRHEGDVCDIQPALRLALDFSGVARYTGAHVGHGGRLRLHFSGVVLGERSDAFERRKPQIRVARVIWRAGPIRSPAGGRRRLKAPNVPSSGRYYTVDGRLLKPGFALRGALANKVVSFGGLPVCVARRRVAMSLGSSACRRKARRASRTARIRWH